MVVKRLSGGYEERKDIESQTELIVPMGECRVGHSEEAETRRRLILAGIALEDIKPPTNQDQ